MSFQNFDTFQAQHGPADATAVPGAPTPADTAMTGQSDPSQAAFQGPTPDAPTVAAGPPPGSEAKTTLWYVEHIASCSGCTILTNGIGWVNWSLGLTRISFGISGIKWGSKSMSR